MTSGRAFRDGECSPSRDAVLAQGSTSSVSSNDGTAAATATTIGSRDSAQPEGPPRGPRGRIGIEPQEIGCRAGSARAEPEGSDAGYMPREGDSSLAGEATLARACVAADEQARIAFRDRFGARIELRALPVIRRLGLIRMDTTRLMDEVATSVSRRWTEWPAGDPERPSFERLIDELEIEDLTIAVACALGDERAWEHFRETYSGFIRASAHQFSRSAIDVQEIFESFFADLFLPRSEGGASALERFRGWSTLKTWLRTVLLFRVRDYYGKKQGAALSLSSLVASEGEEALGPRRGRRGVTRWRSSSEPGSGELFVALELGRQVDRAMAEALRELTAEEVRLLRDYYVRGRTVVEIGKRLGLHKASVSRGLKRVRERIRYRLRESMGDDFPDSEEEVEALLDAVGTSERGSWHRSASWGNHDSA